MTVNEYKRYKEGKYVHKFEIVKKFWNTNPTEEQEIIRSEMIKQVFIISTSLAIPLGVTIGLLLYKILLMMSIKI